MHLRRAAGPYLLRCETCGKAMAAAGAKSGRPTYYVCHSLLKRREGTCKTPRLNAKKFEKVIVDEIRPKGSLIGVRQRQGIIAQRTLIS